MASTEAGVQTDLAEQEIDLKRENAIGKSKFTLYRSKLLLSIEEQGLQATEFDDAFRNFNSQMESSMEVMFKLSDIYIKRKQFDKGRKIVNEMEILEEEFYSTHKAVLICLNFCQIDKTKMTSVDLSQSNCSTEELYRCRAGSGADTGVEVPVIIEECGSISSKRKSTQITDSLRDINTPERMDAQTIGHDLLMQLKRIEIPMFSGNTRSYRNWKAAFMACVDAAPASAEYKLLQLRQCLSGEALNVIESLGYSAAAYEAAKERLERRYGGKRRQVAIYLGDLDRFPQIRHGNVQDLEHFADLLEIATINLKEAGHHHELGNGFLYGKLQTKLTESLLAKYHRWIFETQTPESVLALKTWVFQESEFQIIASETVHGISGTIGGACNKDSQPSPKCCNESTFFGAMIDCCQIKHTPCHVCGGEHKIGACQMFIDKNVPGRWDTAKRLKLCFRCLAYGHMGKSCKNSRPCGQYGCQKLHHVLLHRDDNRQNEANYKCCLLNQHEHVKTSHVTRNAKCFETCNFSEDQRFVDTVGNNRPMGPGQRTIDTEENYQSMESEKRNVDTEGKYQSMESKKYNVDTEGNSRRKELQMYTLDVDNTDAKAPALSVESDCQRKVDCIPINSCTKGNNAAGLECKFKSTGRTNVSYYGGE